MNAPLIPPGDLIRDVETINHWRRERVFVETLPTSAREQLMDTLVGLQAHVDRDPHGMTLAGIMNRLRVAVANGRLGEIQAHDITRLKRWLLTVPTTRRAG
jgi:hypothetical protein